MIRFELTQHSKDVMVKRRIPLEWLERVLAFPQLIEPDSADSMLEHRMAQIPEHENRVLRVIINPHATPTRVVTLFFDRKMRGKL